MLSAKLSRWIAPLRARGLTTLLAALVLLMQYPLWLGDGGWLKVREGIRKLEAQEALNQRLRERNEVLMAEVSDLKQGQDAIEERARSELGMIAPDEIFIRVVTSQTDGKNR
jgi:cell division protein FtsB